MFLLVSVVVAFFHVICTQLFMWNLITGNLHKLSIFFKEYEIIKDTEPEEEEIPVAEVEEPLPVEGIESTYLEAAGHLYFISFHLIPYAVIFLLCHSSNMYLYVADLCIILPLLSFLLWNLVVTS